MLQIKDQPQIAEWVKYNPHHDELGRFASGSGGGGAGLVGFSQIPNEEQSYFLDHTFGGAQKRMSDTGAEAFEGYLRNNYRTINSELRGQYKGEPLEYLSSAKQIKALDTVTKSATIPKNIVVYRGVSGVTFRKGQIVTDKAFLSTTVSFENAKSFAGNAGYIVRIGVPKGTKASCGTGHEREIVFPRGKKLKIAEVHSDGTVDAVMLL